MELWDEYDARREKTGRTLVRGERLLTGSFHLVVEACVMNDAGELLIQRRADEKDILPGLWSLTGGSALAGETSESAVIRENTEEMGFAPDLSRGRLLLSLTRGTVHRDIWLFRQNVAEADIHLQKTEVADWRWALPEDILTDARLQNDFAALSFFPDILPYLRLESARARVPLGRWRHFKGGEYEVVGHAIDSETLAPVIVYRALYGAHETWARPAAMWLETVSHEGRETTRFTRG